MDHRPPCEFLLSTIAKAQSLTQVIRSFTFALQLQSLSFETSTNMLTKSITVSFLLITALAAPLRQRDLTDGLVPSSTLPTGDLLTGDNTSGLSELTDLLTDGEITDSVDEVTKIAGGLTNVPSGIGLGSVRRGFFDFLSPSDNNPATKLIDEVTGSGDGNGSGNGSGSGNGNGSGSGNGNGSGSNDPAGNGNAAGEWMKLRCNAEDLVLTDGRKWQW